MQERVYRTLRLLCTLFARLPVGTNYGLVCLVWMMLSGKLLLSRGAVVPGLSALGLSATAVRRAWAALGSGAWTAAKIIARWNQVVQEEGQWRPHCHGGYRPVAADVTHFLRPRLVNCPTKYYVPRTGKSIPAIPIGVVGRVGSVGGQRLALPLTLVRAPATDPSPTAHDRELLRHAVPLLESDDALVVDRAFRVSMLQEADCHAYVVRLCANATARRATLPPYRGIGRPPTRGALVRPLPRVRKGRAYPATPPDHVATWEEDGRTVRAEAWTDLVLPNAPADSPTFQIIAVFDPHYEDALLLATPLPVTPAVARDLYRDRWPVEQVPLAAKQMIGAHRQFVHAPETCQRLPELALLAGSILTYLAATQPAVPTGFWDRNPQPTPGRLRRALAASPFPESFPLPRRIRKKASVTAHLPKGYWGQRAQSAPRPPSPLASVTGN